MTASPYSNYFKAQTADQNKWIYGDLIRGTHISHSMGATPINPETVCMFADMIDTNGTRVFENDKCRYTACGQTMVGVVVRDRGCFWLRADAERIDPLYKVATIGKLEVIGNIYDERTRS